MQRFSNGEDFGCSDLPCFVTGIRRPVESAPSLLGLHDQLKDPRQGRGATAAFLCLSGAMAHARKGAFDRIGCPQVGPMLGRKGEPGTPPRCTKPWWL